MALGRQYAITQSIAGNTTARTLIQIKAGATTPLWLDYVAVDGQSDVADAMDITIVRKSAAATVTSYTPLLVDPGGPAADAVGGTAATGHTATVEGTDGDILFRRSVSVQAGGGLAERFAPGEIVVAAAGIIAIKHNITITSQTLTVTVLFTEIGNS